VDAFKYYANTRKAEVLVSQGKTGSKLISISLVKRKGFAGFELGTLSMGT
jgi:hypothetical protein